MNDSNETRAPQNALALPEIVSIILEWVYLDCNHLVYMYIPGNPKLPLLNCGLVNRLWFHQAMRYLWKEPIYDDLVKLPERVTPQRQQFYANLVEQARIDLIGDHRIPHYNAMLRELRFPRLIGVFLSMEGDHQENQDWQFHIPRLGSHHTKTLFFDAYCGRKSGVTLHEMDQVLDQIPVAFPRVEDIHFEKKPKLNKGAFERLTEQLPGLKRVDHTDWLSLTEVQKRYFTARNERIWGSPVRQDGRQI